MVLGFLHTAEVHVNTFDRLVSERVTGRATAHAVDAELLEIARAHGAASPLVIDRVAELLNALISTGAQRVLCTCSTVSGTAEAVGIEHGFDVVRVDRPMAAQAVSAGRRVGVVTAVESTLEPTLALLAEEAAKIPEPVEIVGAHCDGAWELFEAGNEGGYIKAIANHVDGLDASIDVVVLAQASMAPAGLFTARANVLSSPAIAIDHVLGY